MSKRDEILAEFQVNANGQICNPGKFEGEMLYVPYFWDAYLNGFADKDDGEILTFYVTNEDVAEFPELENSKQVMLWESDEGFICEL